MTVSRSKSWLEICRSRLMQSRYSIYDFDLSRHRTCELINIVFWMRCSSFCNRTTNDFVLKWSIIDSKSCTSLERTENASYFSTYQTCIRVSRFVYSSNCRRFESFYCFVHEFCNYSRKIISQASSSDATLSSSSNSDVQRTKIVKIDQMYLCDAAQASSSKILESRLLLLMILRWTSSSQQMRIQMSMWNSLLTKWYKIKTCYSTSILNLSRFCFIRNNRYLIWSWRFSIHFCIYCVRINRSY